MSKTHLTMTGVFAGQPICGAARQAHDEGVHLVYAPLDNDEYRANICPDCLKAYVDSFDASELALMPPDHWVRQALDKPSDGQGALFA